VTRGDWLLVAGFAALLALVLAVLGFVDARRAARQLAELEGAICDAPLEGAALERLGALIDEDAAVRPGRRVAAQVLRSFPASSPPEIFYEQEGALWTLSESARRRPDGATRWPQKVGRWEQVAWSEGCRAARDGDQLIVARTVRAGDTHFAVVVARRRRDLAW